MSMSVSNLPVYSGEVKWAREYSTKPVEKGQHQKYGMVAAPHEVIQVGGVYREMKRRNSIVFILGTNGKAYRTLYGDLRMFVKQGAFLTLAVKFSADRQRASWKAYKLGAAVPELLAGQTSCVKCGHIE